MSQKKKQETRLSIFCGLGGVGKTTLSAAYGIHLASQGHRVLVITIDPARRLAQALGVELKTHEIQKVITKQNLSGSLYFLVMDTERSFDYLLTKFIEDPQTLKKLKEHSFFKVLSNSLSNMADYMALNRLYEIIHENSFDQVVLDTPPASHAIEFLNSPERIINFVQSRFINWLIDRPDQANKRFSIQKFLRTQSIKAFGVLAQVLGEKFFEELLVFFNPLSQFFEKLRLRMLFIKEYFVSKNTEIFLVMNLDERSHNAFDFFIEHLSDIKISIQGILINKEKSFLKPSNPADFSTQNEGAFFQAFSQNIARENEIFQEIAAKSNKLGIAIQTIPCTFGILDPSEDLYWMAQKLSINHLKVM